MVILTHSRRYQYPYLCSVCGVAHEYKTYHINVDSQGDAVVSGEILDHLKELDDTGGWKVLGVEHNPEPIRLEMGGAAQTFDVVFQPTEVLSENPLGG